MPFVTFGPGSLTRGASPGRGGEIDYRMARRALISEYRKGRLARHQVCDAHPELVRAAREVGDTIERKCPICEEHPLVLVTYVFGPRLPPHGRCLSAPGELAKLAKRADQLAVYVVEVCPDCSWNHLIRTFLTGGGRKPAAARG